MSDHIEHECTECGCLLCPSTHCLKPSRIVVHALPKCECPHVRFCLENGCQRAAAEPSRVTKDGEG
jgi:hypothetical protein